jgi:hypothetical protein
MVSRLVPLIAAAVLAAFGCAACGAGGSRADAGSASSAGPVSKRHALIWAVGDSAGGDHAAEVARLIRRGKPDKVLYLGDIYNGDFAAYKRLYGSLPVARTPGNHDWPHFWSGPEWYSFRAAGWRIIELNSETGRGGAQLAYLKTLLRARGTCRIAFWHRPRYSGGLHGDNADMDPYWRALGGHASLVLGGHDHDMQRFAPRGGLTELVSGAGGQSHYPVGPHVGLRFRDSSHWGALRIDLRRGSARTAFVATDGRVLDTYTVSCRP